jgi:hypothetical protein
VTGTGSSCPRCIAATVLTAIAPMNAEISASATYDSARRSCFRPHPSVPEPASRTAPDFCIRCPVEFCGARGFNGYPDFGHRVPGFTAQRELAWIGGRDNFHDAGDPSDRPTSPLPGSCVPWMLWASRGAIRTEPSESCAVRGVDTVDDCRPVPRRRSAIAALDAVTTLVSDGDYPDHSRPPDCTWAVGPRGRDNRKVGIKGVIPNSG